MEGDNSARLRDYQFEVDPAPKIPGAGWLTFVFATLFLIGAICCLAPYLVAPKKASCVLNSKDLPGDDQLMPESKLHD
jgi:hypothetical protein